MTALILVVEDDDDFFTDLAGVLSEFGNQVEFVRAVDRDSAIHLLQSEYFDLIILDLKIPPSSESLEADPSHGRAVFGEARSIAPGTPIFVLTGSPAEDFIADMLAQAQTLDIWCTGSKTGTITFLKKYNFEQFPAIISTAVRAVNDLAEIELVAGNVNFTIEEDRLLRIFARRVGGVRCRITQISGGLSAARVVRIMVTDTNGALIHEVVGKLGTLADVRDEAERFNTYIARLDARVTPRHIATMEYGARGTGGVFYGLAEGFEFSCFDVAFESAAPQETTVRGIEAGTSRWRLGVPESRKSIKDIRRVLLSDQDASRLASQYHLEWTDQFEERHIQVRWSAIHGDLHGANVLVDRQGTSVLIDYGDVQEGPASLDPVTLELSMLFHPARRVGNWPTIELSEQWGQTAVYSTNCPYTEFLIACRAWQTQVAAGPREVAVCAYAYLLRQLKYEDTDKSLALGLLRGARSYFQAT